MRFTCPNDPTHDEFYLRRQSSEAWHVSPEGGIALQEMSNSYDGEGDSPIYCDDCDNLAWRQRYVEHTVSTIVTPVECVDNDPGVDLFEDESL